MHKFHWFYANMLLFQLVLLGVMHIRIHLQWELHPQSWRVEYIYIYMECRVHCLCILQYYLSFLRQAAIWTLMALQHSGFGFVFCCLFVRCLWVLVLRSPFALACSRWASGLTCCRVGSGQLDSELLQFLQFLFRRGLSTLSKATRPCPNSGHFIHIIWSLWSTSWI
jgi:hypothetical protein